MSDNVPANHEVTPNSTPNACTAGCQHKKGGGLLRAVLYTPVIIVLGGLAALATFPDLAQYASPLIDQLPKSAMNQKCGSRCPSSTPAIDLSNPVYQQAPTCCEASNVLTKRFASMGLGCCEDSATCPASSAASADGALAMITEDATAELPADATAAVNAIESDTASN